MTSTRQTKAHPTVDEILATLRNTSLPTVLCEGKDDLIVYRRLEDKLSHLNVDLLPVGGRENILEIFKRRNEIPAKVKFALIADRDTWVNTEVPIEFSSLKLCLTYGYSIENDVIIDGQLESLLQGNDQVRYQSELNEFINWYALMLQRHLNDPNITIKDHPKKFLESQNKQELLELQPGESYPNELKQTLLTDYKRLVRGKSLLSLLIKVTNSRSGQAKHTDKGLLEMVAIKPSTLLNQITTNVENALSSPH